MTGATDIGSTPLEKYEHKLDVISAGCITPSGMEEDYRWACRHVLQACAVLHCMGLSTVQCQKQNGEQACAVPFATGSPAAGLPAC